MPEAGKALIPVDHAEQDKPEQHPDGDDVVPHPAPHEEAERGGQRPDHKDLVERHARSPTAPNPSRPYKAGPGGAQARSAHGRNAPLACCRMESDNLPAMNIFKASERLMGMSDAAWARHANPLSVYSRFSCLPLIALAIWSRDWIGWWSVIATALALGWTFINPRLFSAPSRADNWASQGVIGERIFLNRSVEPAPPHHVRAAHLLTGASAVGVLILIYGLVILDLWAVICGLFVTVLPKVWFVDRMVRIAADMPDQAAVFDPTRPNADRGR